MTDLFFFGGPVNCSTLKNIVWRRETQIYCKPIAGSSPNYSYYQSLGNGLQSIADKAGVPDFVSFGMAGFSAFHGFARAALKDERHRERIRFLHLADACFMGAGAKEPFSAFVWFGSRAARGEVRMVVTSNGPAGKSIHYSYQGKDFNLTSGEQCVRLFYERVLQTVGGVERVPDPPPGVPEPTFAKQLGELYWFHYETAPKGKGAHEWHANDLAAPFIQKYAPDWMAGELPAGELPVVDVDLSEQDVPLIPRPQPRWLLYGGLAAVGAASAWLLWRTK